MTGDALPTGRVEPSPTDPASVEAFAYFYPRRAPRAEADDCAAFLLYVQPRLPVITARYEDRGRSFGVYLSACLRNEWRSYARKGRQARLIDAGTATMARHIWATNTDAGDDAPAEWSPRPITKDSHRRRVMVATLKAAGDLEDSQVAVIAQSIGCPELPELVTMARGLVQSERRELLRDRMVANLGRRLTGYESRAGRVPSAQTYTTAARELRALRTGPSDRQVAQLLGVTKATVSGALYALRHRGVAA